MDFKTATNLELTDFLSFKKHEGKLVLKTIELPDELERSINQTLSSIYNSLEKNGL